MFDIFRRGKNRETTFSEQVENAIKVEGLADSEIAEAVRLNRKGRLAQAVPHLKIALGYTGLAEEITKRALKNHHS